jgi:hypothetical protein
MDIGKKSDIIEEKQMIKEINSNNIQMKNEKIGWFSDCSTPTANEVIYMSQILSIFIVIITSLYNLSAKTGDDSLWTALLTSCLGYLLPNPKIKKSSQQESQSPI